MGIAEGARLITARDHYTGVGGWDINNGPETWKDIEPRKVSLGCVVIIWAAARLQSTTKETKGSEVQTSDLFGDRYLTTVGAYDDGLVHHLK